MFVFCPWTLNLPIAIVLLRLRVHYSVEIKRYKSQRSKVKVGVLRPVQQSGSNVPFTNHGNKYFIVQMVEYTIIHVKSEQGQSVI